MLPSEEELGDLEDRTEARGNSELVCVDGSLLKVLTAPKYR